MNYFETALSWFNLSFVMVLCGSVLVRRVHRILPLFAAYTYVLFISMVGVWLIYRRFGFQSLTSYYFYWGSVLLNATARSFAIAELCRYGLRAYRGIWALVWRILTALSILLFARVAVDAWGQPNRVAIYGTTLDRDLALASIVILMVLFMFRNYYGIAYEPLQSAIATGICFICAVDVVANTILRNLFTGYFISFFMANQKSLWLALEPQVQRVNDLWSAFHLLAFMVSAGIWCFAFRKPLPEQAAAPELLPAHVYRELSPAINMRLATFNDRMLELLKI
jgi:hypothetical protein